MFNWFKRLFKKEQKFYDAQVEKFFMELDIVMGRDKSGRFTKGNKYAKMRKK